MKKGLCTIGELLIDFIPDEKGKRLKDVVSFTKAAGGAPANVAGAAGKLGIYSTMLTKVGNDAFGDYLIDCLKEKNVDTSHILKSDDYDTSLAYVSLADDGNREFKFYRRTAADLQLSKHEVDLSVLEQCGIVHFCSVDLIDSPMKETHRFVIEKAIEKGLMISFDPNLRFSLWNDTEKLKETVHDFMKYANILKLSDEELEFITGETDIENALPLLLKNRCEVVIYTKGKDGVELYTKDIKVSVPGYKVNVIDTTGAGDSFIGSFLYQLLNDEIHDFHLTKETYLKYLDFSNLYAAYITTQPGGLASMTDVQTIETFKKSVSH